MNTPKLTVDQFIAQHKIKLQAQQIMLLHSKLRNYRILCVVLLLLHIIAYMSK